MNLNLRGLVLVLASVMGLLFSGEANAQSCTTLLQDRVNWLSQYGRYLDIRGTSLNAAHSNGWGLVSYVNGYMMQYTAGFTYSDPFTGRQITVPSRVSGTDIYQTFSDRFATGSQPFDKSRPDKLGISIDTNGKIVITLETWGNNTLTITNTACLNDVIYGTSTDGTHWSFRLIKGYIPG
jgi:hypothetical protein